MPRTQIFSTGFHHCRGKVIHRLLRGTSNSSPRRRMNNFGNRIREQRTDKEMRHQRAGSETGAPIARFGGTARIVRGILSSKSEKLFSRFSERIIERIGM